MKAGCSRLRKVPTESQEFLSSFPPFPVQHEVAHSMGGFAP